MTDVQFTVDTEADEGFYVTVADAVTVYESYDGAIAEIQEKIQTDTESFVAEVAIEANSEDDVAIKLEQISWQQVIQDMATSEEGIDS